MDLSDLRARGRLTTDDPLPIDRPFTSSTAEAEGVGPGQLKWLVDHGYLRRPIRNVYWASQLPDTTQLRCRALALVIPDDAVVVDRHAAWLHGSDSALAPNEHLEAQPISVFRPSGGGRLRNVLTDSGERNLSPEDVVEVHGLRVSTPLRTAWDLGRVRWPSASLAGLDAMLRLELFAKEQLLEGIERFRGMRWITVLRLTAPLADGRAASAGESVLRLRWIEAGLPAPVPQLPVWDDGELLGVLDLGCEELRYAAEFDGAAWHSSSAQRSHDLYRRRGLAEARWFVDVFTTGEVFGPAAPVEARLRAGAAEARRRRGAMRGESA